MPGLSRRVFSCCFRHEWLTVWRFYQALYPNRSRLFHLWCAWRQFHNFTDVFLDRFLLEESDEITYTSKGLEHLQKSMDSGQGGILLMSHMGNWDVAAHLLKRKVNLRLLLYMGIKQKEQIEQIQKENLSQSGIRIIVVEEDGGSPVDIMEGIKFIESGGVVSLTGDLVWKRINGPSRSNFSVMKYYCRRHPIYLPYCPAPHCLFFLHFGPEKININLHCRSPFPWIATRGLKEPGRFSNPLNNTPISWKQPFATILCSGTISDLFFLQTQDPSKAQN